MGTWCGSEILRLKNYKVKAIHLGFIFFSILLMDCSGKNSGNGENQQNEGLLIFTKTTEYRHESIERGVEVVIRLASELGYSSIHTEDSSAFTEENLKKYKAVVFLNTTGDILNKTQQDAFQNFIEGGGGFIGIHSASDTEYEWPWYGKLVGGYFDSHPNDPNVRQAVVRKVQEHYLLDSIPEDWERMDEWYNFKDINPAINILQMLDESTYEGGTMSEDHPITWYHEYEGGRVFYTGMGHTSETFDEEVYRKLIKNALEYVMGKDVE